MRKEKNNSVCFGLERYIYLCRVRSARYVFYYKNFESKITDFTAKNLSDIVKHDKFIQEKPTTIYSHGFRTTPTSTSIITIISAYMKRNQHNFIVISWYGLAGKGYFTNAVPNAYMLSVKVARDVLKATKKGLNLKYLHLVGHSLGAHLMGSVGRQIREASEGEIIIPRITGLDPAMPGFYPENRMFEPIDGLCAEFVDIIHSDAGVLGAPVATGTVDFWPNGGFFAQPGCSPLAKGRKTRQGRCSHNRAINYWAESVTDEFYPLEFYAAKARSWIAFLDGKMLQIPKKIVMGINCRDDIDGNFYLRTNGSPPFAKGMNGVHYKRG